MGQADLRSPDDARPPAWGPIAWSKLVHTPAERDSLHRAVMHEIEQVSARQPLDGEQAGHLSRLRGLLERLTQ